MFSACVDVCNFKGINGKPQLLKNNKRELSTQNANAGAPRRGYCILPVFEIKKDVENVTEGRYNGVESKE